MRRAGLLRRCLGKLFLCSGICECLFSFYRRQFVAVVVLDFREIYHGLYSRVVRVCFDVCPVYIYYKQIYIVQNAFFNAPFVGEGRAFS